MENKQIKVNIGNTWRDARIINHFVYTNKSDGKRYVGLVVEVYRTPVGQDSIYRIGLRSVTKTTRHIADAYVEQVKKEMAARNQQ